MTGAFTAFALAAGLFPVSTPARAETVEQFYKGRTITLLISTSPGGLYDLNSRLIARYLGRYIPGKPTVVVQNTPGAGGLILANRLANSSERDGSVVAVVQPATSLLALQGDKNAKFDPLQLNWIGSLSSSANDGAILIVNASYPVKSAFDMRKPHVAAKIGADLPGSTNLVWAMIARDVLKLNIQLVRGYAGSPSLFLAMQRGELDGQVAFFDAITSSHLDLWKAHAFTPLVQFGRRTRLPSLPDVPTGRELVDGPAGLALLNFAETPFFMSMPLVGPPDIPPDRVEALRTAFMEMTNNPEFIKDMATAHLEYSPIDGAAVLRLLENASKTPKDVIKNYNSIVNSHN